LHNPYSPFHAISKIAGNVDMSAFDCADPDFNDYIRSEALNDQQENFSVTYIGFIGGIPAGFLSLVAGAYKTASLGKTDIGKYSYRSVPAIKIARLAVDNRFKGKGCGRVLVEYAFYIAKMVRRMVGCRLVVTDALPERIGWYEGFGFKLSSQHVKAEKRKNYPMHATLLPDGR
jgi:GNAT superfamily N-acetyltransferase